MNRNYNPHAAIYGFVLLLLLIVSILEASRFRLSLKGATIYDFGSKVKESLCFSASQKHLPMGVIKNECNVQNSEYNRQYRPGKTGADAKLFDSDGTAIAMGV